MIHILYKNILLNLGVVNNLQSKKMSIEELKLVIEEIKTVYKKTTGYVTEQRKELKAKIKNAKNENEDTEIIQNYKDELESLKSIKSKLHKKDTLELFVNINAFLSAAITNPLILKEININNIDDLVTSFNIISIFDKKIGKRKIKLHYSTIGTSGEPDVSILKNIDGKWTIDFIAASNTADSQYESLQLFLHPFSLQKALDKVREDYKGKEEELIKLSHKEMSELVLEKYKPFTIEDDKSINEFFDYILDTENEKLFSNINIQGAYSNKSLLFLNNKDNKNLISKFIIDGILTKSNYLMEIEEIGNWIMMDAQLASVFKLISDKTKLSEDDITKKTILTLEDKKNILDNRFVNLIKFMNTKMTYISSVSGILEEKKFSDKFNDDEWINFLFETINKHSTKGNPVISDKKVKGNITSFTSFIKRGYELSSFNIPELEKTIGEQNYEVKSNSQEHTIKHINVLNEALIDVKNEYEEELHNLLEVKGIPGKLSLSEEKLAGKIERTMNIKPEEFVEDFFTILNDEMYNIDYVNFLNIMKSVGKLPDTIDKEVIQDIENIINIFENLENIFGIKIENSKIKILFNNILKNSFNKQIISYEDFVDNLTVNLLNIYEKNSSTVFNKSIRVLTNNIDLRSNEDSKKLLSKVIREKAQNIMKEKRDEVKKTNKTTPVKKDTKK